MATLRVVRVSGTRLLRARFRSTLTTRCALCPVQLQRSASFSYTISDGSASVHGSRYGYGARVNDAPLARDPTAPGGSGSSVTVQVLANDVTPRAMPFHQSRWGASVEDAHVGSSRLARRRVGDLQRPEQLQRRHGFAPYAIRIVAGRPPRASVELLQFGAHTLPTLRARGCYA
jgi:hypothetical protein